MGETSIHSSGGGSPNDSVHPANAEGEFAIGAGEQTWTLADWLDAWEQYEKGREDEKATLDQEKRELESELANATDPAARAEIEQQLREVAIDRSVIDTSYDLAVDPFESGTGHFEPGDYHSWAEQGGLDPYDPETASKYNTYMPAQYNRSYINALKDGVEADSWFYFNVLKPIGWVADIPINPGSILQGLFRRGIKKVAPRILRMARRLARPKRQERVVGRRRDRKKRRDCRLSGNPTFMPTGVAAHFDPQFRIEGLIALELGSMFYGDLEQSGPLGRHRITEFDATIQRDEHGRFVFIDDEGFVIHFKPPTPTPGGWVEGSTDRRTELQQGHRRSLLFRENGRVSTFNKCADDIWRISRIEDRLGNALVFDRDADSNLLKITTPEGLKVQFEYVGTNQRSLITLEGVDGSRKVVMRYAYDSSGRLILAECPYGERHEFTYDENGQILRLIRNGDYEANYEYDKQQRRTRIQTNRKFNPARFEYDEENGVSTYLPAGDPSRAQKFFYNDSKNITREVNGLGHEKRTIENDRGLVAAVVDGEGNSISYTYDPFCNVASTTDAEGRSTFFVWSSDNALEMVIDNAGKSWQYQYDDRGSLQQVTDPLGHITEIKNNAAGQPIGISRHDGLLEQHGYDSHHWLKETLDFRGGRTRYERDGFGRVTAVIDTMGQTTRFSYEDQSGMDFYMPANVKRPDGVTNRIESRNRGREVITVDGEGNSTTYIYDGLGNIVEVIDPEGNRLRFVYDDEFKLAKVVNATGREWTFDRDPAGRIVRETDFDGKVTTYGYDKADRVTETTHPDGRTTSYAWDGSGLLLRRTVALPGRDEIEEETYTYDDRGLLASLSNASSTVTLEYDDASRLIAETVNGLRVESLLDCCGNRIERKIGAHIATYSYDPMGALTSLSVGGQMKLTIVRDKAGRERERSSTQSLLLEHHYDVVGQLISQTAHYSPKSSSSAEPRAPRHPVASQWTRFYQWNRTSSPIAVSDPLWGETRYKPDSNNQITEATHGSDLKIGQPPALGRTGQNDIPGFPSDAMESERFAYSPTLDVAGSQTALPEEPLGRPIASWTSSGGGRVEAARGPRGESINFVYDANGRVIERRVERDGFRPVIWRFVWDGFDRMTQAICPDGSLWRYSYDPLGRRIDKRLLPTAGQAGFQTLSSGTRFVWDGNVIAAEVPLVREGHAPRNGMSDELPRATWWHFLPNSFTPLLREDGASGDVLHIVTDHLGTPKEMVDDAGSLVWAASYRLWGDIRSLWSAATNDNQPRPETAKWVAAAGNNALDISAAWNSEVSYAELRSAGDADTKAARMLCPIRFQGQWEDVETGLFYNLMRTYDPLSCQYMSSDPIGLLGGLRQNGYVAYPTEAVDPLGLATLRNNLIAAGRGMNVPWQAHHLIPCAVWGNHRPMFNALGMRRDAASNGIALPTDATNANNPPLPIHRGSHATYNARNETAVSGIEAKWRRARNCAKTSAQRAAADNMARRELVALQQQNVQIIRAFASAFPGANMNQCP